MRPEADHYKAAAAAAAKLHQSCPTLCDPIDGSPPGSPVPGILQARALEWGAIAFSNRSTGRPLRLEASPPPAFFLTLSLVHTEPDQQFINYTLDCPARPHLALALAQVSATVKLWFSVPVCLQNGSGLPTSVL